MYEIISLHQDIQGLSDVWITDIYDDVVDVPSSLDQKIEKLEESIGDALKYVDEIIAEIEEGNDEGYTHSVSLLLNSIEDMESYSKSIYNKVQTVTNELSSLNENTLNDLKDAIDKIIAELSSTELEDQKEVKKLMNDINELQKKLSKAEANLAAACIGTGLSGGVIALGLVFCGGIGGAVIGLFAGIAALIGTTFIILDSIEIEKCKNLIEADQQNMSLYQLDISALGVVLGQYQGLLGSMDNLKGAAGKIGQIWIEVSGEITEVYEWVQAHDEESDLKDWADMKNSLTEFKGTCEELMEQMAILDVSNLQVSTAQLELGMSSADIEAAIKNAEMVSFPDYFKAM